MLEERNQPCIVERDPFCDKRRETGSASGKCKGIGIGGKLAVPGREESLARDLRDE